MVSVASPPARGRRSEPRKSRPGTRDRLHGRTFSRHIPVPRSLCCSGLGGGSLLGLVGLGLGLRLLTGQRFDDSLHRPSPGANVRTADGRNRTRRLPQLRERIGLGRFGSTVFGVMSSIMLPRFASLTSLLSPVVASCPPRRSALDARASWKPVPGSGRQGDRRHRTGLPAECRADDRSGESVDGVVDADGDGAKGIADQADGIADRIY